jgi:hypothetical protein
MNMRHLVLAGLVGGLIFGAPALAEGEFAGAWAVEVNTGQAVRTATWTVTEAEGGGYAVEISQDGATSAGTDVTFDGTTFTFKRTITSPQGSLDASYTGTIEGDALTAEVDLGQIGKFPVTGKRQ